MYTQRVSRQRLPPSVPKRRSWGPAICAQALQHPLRIEGQFPDADPARVVKSICDRRYRRVQGALAGLLRAVGARGVVALDDIRLQIRGIERGRNPIIEQRRPEEQALVV